MAGLRDETGHDNSSNRDGYFSSGGYAGNHGGSGLDFGNRGGGGDLGLHGDIAGLATAAAFAAGNGLEGFVRQLSGGRVRGYGRECEVEFLGSLAHNAKLNPFREVRDALSQSLKDGLEFILQGNLRKDSVDEGGRVLEDHYIFIRIEVDSGFEQGCSGSSLEGCTGLGIM